MQLGGVHVTVSLTLCCSASGQDELVYHMVANCRMRVVVCVLCSHRARLPDMLLHLRLHQVRGGHRSSSACTTVSALHIFQSASVQPRTPRSLNFDC